MSSKKLTIENNFPERLKVLIKERLNITQTAFCIKIGISQGYLSMVLSGERGPSAELIAGLYYHYSKYLHWILTGESPGFDEGVGLDVFKVKEQITSFDKKLKHKDIISRFKNKDLAKEINIKLLELESLNESELKYIAGILDGLLKKLREDATIKKQNTQADGE